MTFESGALDRSRNWLLVVLGHHDFSASGGTAQDIELIHKSFHKKHSPPRIAQHVFIVPRIGNIGKLKSRSLIAHVDNQFFVMEFEYDVDFFVTPLIVTVLIGVHDAFMNCEADLILVILIKAGRGGNTHTNFFRESDALDERFQDNFDPLRS